MEQLEINTLHHAYFLVGDRKAIANKLLIFFENVKIKTTGNPDFWHAKFKTLTIDDARMFAEAEVRKDFSGRKKIFIIEADFITEEAQNSLLKVFEEPTAGTHFFIISPQDILLPTLRSRMHVISENGKYDKTEFLRLKLKEHLSKVKEITDSISDEEGTKQDAISLLNDIEKELHAEKNWKALKVCEQTRQALYDRGAAIKMILENLVLNI